MLISVNVLDSKKFCHVTISFKNCLYRQNHNSQNRTARKGLPRQDWHRIARTGLAQQQSQRQDSQYRTGKTEEASREGHKRTVRKEQPGPDSQDRTAWSGPPEQDNKNRTIRTSTTNFFFKTEEISIPHKKVFFTSSKFIFKKPMFSYSTTKIVFKNNLLGLIYILKKPVSVD